MKITVSWFVMQCSLLGHKMETAHYSYIIYTCMFLIILSYQHKVPHCGKQWFRSVGNDYFQDKKNLSEYRKLCSEENLL